MARWTPVAPWKLGTAQQVVLGATAAAFGSNVGTHTQALMLTCTGANIHFIVSPGGRDVATGSTGTLMKTTDSPLVIGCAPGDNVNCFGSGSTVSLTELTH